MHATALFVLAVAGFAAAQSSALTAPSVTSAAATSGSTSESGCGSAVDAIIQNCLGTENAQLMACAATDWDCMCTQITNVVTCYNNCPSAPDAFAATQRQTSYCNAAKQFGSSASSSASGSAVTSAPATGSSAAGNVAAVATTTSSSASVTVSSTATPTSNSMAHLAAPAGGAFAAAFLGLVALL